MIQEFKQRAEAIQNNIVELNKLYGSGQRGLAKTTQMFRKKKTIQDMLEAYTNDIEQAELYDNDVIMDYHGKLERNFDKLCEAIDQDKSLTKSMKLLDGMAKQSQIQNQLRQEDFEYEPQQSSNRNNKVLNTISNLNRSQNLNRSNRMVESYYIDPVTQQQNLSQNQTNPNNATQVMNYEENFYPQQNLNMVLNKQKNKNQNQNQNLNLSQQQKQQLQQYQIKQQQQQMPQNQQNYHHQYVQPYGDSQPQTPGSRRTSRHANYMNRSGSQRQNLYLNNADLEGQYSNNSNYNNNNDNNNNLGAYQNHTRPTEMGDDYAYTEQELNQPYSGQSRKLKMLGSSNNSANQQLERFCQFGNCQKITIAKCDKCKKCICEEHKFRSKKGSNAPQLNKYGVDMNKEFKSFCKKCSKRKRQYECKYLEQTFYCSICVLMLITIFVVILLELGIFDK